jgi:hypothetical protein
MITSIKLTGETVAAAVGVSAGMGLSAVPARMRGSVIQVDGVPGLGGSGLSRDWTVADGLREERSERPTSAPKAAAVITTCGYAHAFGAGTRQIDQQIQAPAAIAAKATFSMRALRGLEPWRERT